MLPNNPEGKRDMVRKNNKTIAKLFALLIFVTLCFTVFAVPVSAEGSDGSSEQEVEKSKLLFLKDMNTDEVVPAVVEPIYANGA